MTPIILALALLGADNLFIAPANLTYRTPESRQSTSCIALVSRGEHRMDICMNGDITIDGKRITEDREVYRMLKAFLRGECGGSTEP